MSNQYTEQNITHPGLAPIDGDMILRTWPTGKSEQYRFNVIPQIADYTGFPAWSVVTAEPVAITNPGPLPADVTLLAPCDYPQWAGDRWIVSRIKVAQAKSEMISSLLNQHLLANFTGADGHIYYADAWATKTIETTGLICGSLLLLQDKALADLVPSPPPLSPGQWITAERDEHGQRVVVSGLTIAQMLQLTVSLYNRNAILWGIATLKNAQIETMLANDATAEEILAVDPSIGWNLPG